MASRRLRLCAAALLGLAVMLLIVRLWMLQGLWTTVRIEGGSMAPTFPGERVEITCANCDDVWECDRVLREATSHVLCPNCGRAVEDESSQVIRAGARVVIDRAAYLLAPPQRFDVVALRSPLPPHELGVKRIVALPGERWAIDRGELLIGGKLVRKTYRQFRETAAEVSRSHPQAKNRWQPEKGDWLVYHSLARHPAAAEQPSPVLDDDPYNPGLPRELNAVTDLMAECQVIGAGPIELRIHDGYATLDLSYDMRAGQVIARRGEREIAKAKVPSAEKSSRKIAWGVVDRQLWLVIDDRVVLSHQLDETSKPPEPIATPLAIRVTGACRVERLRVVRDVYYLDAARGGSKWTAKFDGDEYGVLGDNPPLSIDSRQWEQGVPRGDILGKVLHR
jgi:signal peptidase I